MDEATRTIAALIPEGDEAQDKSTFKTCDGIVFKLKRVPPMLLMDAQRQHKPPQVPLVRNDDKDALEENPNDPDYLKAVEEYQQRASDLANAIMLSRGTVLVSKPDDIPGPDDTEWSQELEELAGDDSTFKIPKVGKRRYYFWMKYVALTSMDDFSKLSALLTGFSGATTEEDVAQATADFPGDETRAADSGVSSGEGSGHGNTDNVTVLRPGT